MEVVKTVEDFARSNGVSRIDTLVLQVGELSSMVPQYVEDCFQAAAQGTILEGSRLRIEILPGNAACGACGKVFNVRMSEGICPSCGSRDWELLCGKEFLIKEIVAC
jgi:hydrogenase nickel incorporation protein HypA/HybF